VTISWVAAGGTHVGRIRRENEDAFRIDNFGGIFLIADGMGGHAAGEVASALAADTALENLGREREDGDDTAIESRILLAFRAAHERMAKCCADDPSTMGMGTTLTASLLLPEGDLWIGHIGDSRLYQLRRGELRQLTRDHTWVQQEVDAGRIAPKKNRSHPLSHVLTRVLSAEQPAEPDIGKHEVAPGDVLLLSSDGLHGVVDGQTLLDTLIADHPPAEIVQRLIVAANRRGGPDNVTAVYIRIV